MTRVCRLGGDKKVFFLSLCRRKGGGVHLWAEEVGRLPNLGKKGIEASRREAIGGFGAVPDAGTASTTP